MTYQDRWRDGQLVEAGERNCEARWRALRRAFLRVPEPFTVLDLGANAGYFPLRLVDEFDCHVTAVDDHPDLPAVASDRITVIHRRVTASDLRAMPRVDVVVALSVLHHMGDWRAALGWLRACRVGALIEVPHPDERWMRSAAARHQLDAIHAAAGAGAETWITSQRVGRDGSIHERPTFLVPGRLATITGTVFGGSGTCSRKLRPDLHARGLDRALGYQPYPGSLNLRCGADIDLGTPIVDWPGLVRGRSRPYWFWPAWLDGQPVHAMDPAGRGHGPDCIEVVAPDRLRDRLGLVDGDTVTLEVLVDD